jgi:hypothetical protein
MGEDWKKMKSTWLAAEKESEKPEPVKPRDIRSWRKGTRFEDSGLGMRRAKS